MTVEDVVEGCSTKSAWWCPAPLLKMVDLALAAPPPPPGPERGARLGSGTFGRVYRHASSDSLVIKVLQRPLDVLQDMSEVYALEKGRGHPHIVQLHDVAMDSSSGMGKRLCLILERCDTDLEKLIRENSEDGPSPLQLRRIASQACSALRHLHAAGLVHKDLAAKNILVKWRQPGLTSGGASGSLYDIQIRRQGQADEARDHDHEEGDEDSRRQGQGDEAQDQDHEGDEDSRRQGEHEGEEGLRSQGGRVAENTDQDRRSSQRVRVPPHVPHVLLRDPSTSAIEARAAITRGYDTRTCGYDYRDTGCMQALDVGWIEIKWSHQQGLPLGVGGAQLLQAAPPVPRHRQASLIPARAPRAMHV